MENLKITSSIQANYDQLILLDDDLILEYQQKNEDLYDELVKEPTFTKKQSIKYDYRPNLDVLFNYEQNISQGTYQGNSEVSKEEKQNKAQLSNRQTSLKTERLIKCKCSKTKCQKNYCDCFRAGLPCGPECVCLECSNDLHNHELLKLKKKQVTGCKCKKSKCLKKYCECHSAGKKCTPECICQDCQNMEEQQDIVEGSQPRKKVKLEMDYPLLSFTQKNHSKMLFDLY